MTYLRTPDEAPAYGQYRQNLGYVPNWGRVLALAPDSAAAWNALTASIKASMDERRYELVTLVAAQRLDSRYCTLAHAAVLREKFFDDEALGSIVADRHTAGLDPADLAAMDFAERIALDPAAATAADVETLRGQGLSEVDILMVVLTVTARRFFSGTLDAVGAVPDPAYDDVARLLRTGQETTVTVAEQ